MDIAQLLNISSQVRLIVASKYVDDKIITILHQQGFNEFGENQIQALAAKKEKLKNYKNIQWHFIGNLQSNKINLLLKQRPVLWQSCNGLKQALAVNKRLDYELDTLLEINTALETSKTGINPQKAVDEYLTIKEQCPKIKLCGIMSIGAQSQNNKDIIKSFEQSYKLYEHLQKYGAKICSMGMSGDFELALKCGSNMIRLGSVVFKALNKEASALK